MLRQPLAALSLILAALAFGCGGEDSAEPASRAAQPETGAIANTEASAPSDGLPEPDGRSADEQAAASAALELLHQMAKGDGERVCALMTAQARAQVVRDNPGEGSTCTEVRTAAFRQYGGEQRRSLARTRVTKVQLNGDRALVFYVFPIRGSPEVTLAMERARGSWKLGVR